MTNKTEMKIRQSINLNAEINAQDGEEKKGAVYLSATLSTNQQSTTNLTVVDRELYNTNRAEIRAKIREFQDEVWRLEDGLVSDEEAGNGVIEDN